jgi:hypothetical protein
MFIPPKYGNFIAFDPSRFPYSLQLWLFTQLYGHCLKNDSTYVPEGMLG